VDTGATVTSDFNTTGWYRRLWYSLRVGRVKTETVGLPFDMVHNRPTWCGACLQPGGRRRRRRRRRRRGVVE